MSTSIVFRYVSINKYRFFHVSISYRTRFSSDIRVTIINDTHDMVFLSDGEGDDHEASGRLHEAGGNVEADSRRAGGGEEWHGERRRRRVRAPPLPPPQLLREI